MRFLTAPTLTSNPSNNNNNNPLNNNKFSNKFNNNNNKFHKIIKRIMNS